MKDYSYDEKHALDDIDLDKLQKAENTIEKLIQYESDIDELKEDLEVLKEDYKILDKTADNILLKYRKLSRKHEEAIDSYSRILKERNKIEEL